MDPLLERAIRGVGPAARAFTPRLKAANGILIVWYEVAQTAHSSSGDKFGKVEQIVL
jgi:hypothetical protein